MLRYKTEIGPGLVALYDIRPVNGAGQFLQPWSPHGAKDVLTNANVVSEDQLTSLSTATRGNRNVLLAFRQSTFSTTQNSMFFQLLSRTFHFFRT